MSVLQVQVEAIPGNKADMNTGGTCTGAENKRYCTRFEYYSCDISEVSYLADKSHLILIRHNEFLQLLKMLCFD